MGADPAVDEAAIPAGQKAFHALYSTTPPPAQPATNVVGGGSVSDNPNRFMYYPSHPIDGSPGGVVLATYTWADDASRSDSMEDDDRYAFGEAAVLAPGQLTQFQSTITEPEGVVHFAGEHTSVKHAWIEGALESAVRTALEINEMAAS